LREDEFEGRIEADIAVDDVVAPVDDEERGNRVDAIVNINSRLRARPGGLT